MSNRNNLNLRDGNELESVAQNPFTTRCGRFACYDYLEAIYRIYRRWHKIGKARKLSRALAHQHGIKIPRVVSPIRVLLKASYPLMDPKTASKWTRALEYAAYRGAKPINLKKFFSKHGGIAGCANAAAHELPRRTVRRDYWAETS